MRAVGGGGNGFVAVGEAVVIKDINHQRVAPVAGLAVVKRILHRRNGDIEPRGDVAVGATVGDGVGHLRHVAVPVGDRNKGIAAVGVEGQRAVARKRGGLAGGPGGIAHRKRFHRQRVAVQVAGARQQIFAVGKRCVFRRAAGFSQADLRRVVDQSEGDRRGFGFAAAGDGIGEGIGADIAAGRRVNHLAVADANRTVSAVGLAGNRFVGIAETVVMQRIDSDRNTRMGAGRIVLRVRHRRYAKGERGGGDAAVFAVADGVGRGRRHAVPVGHWHKGEAAVGADRQIAIACQRRGVAREVAGAADGKLRHGEGVAIVIVGVSQQVLRRSAVKRGVFRRGNRRYAGQTRRHVGDVHGNGRGFGFAAAGDGVVEGVAADIARVRAVDERVVLNRHRAVGGSGDAGNRLVAVAEAVVVERVDHHRHIGMGADAVVDRIRDRVDGK